MTDIKPAVEQFIEALEWADEQEIVQLRGNYISEKTYLSDDLPSNQWEMCALGVIYLRIMGEKPTPKQSLDCNVQQNLVHHLDLRFDDIDRVFDDIIAGNDGYRLGFSEIAEDLRSKYLTEKA